MELTLAVRGRKQLVAQVYQELRETIFNGRVKPGERLPSTRELAQRLSVCRNTVNEAYERLAGEGYLIGRRGSGTYVSGHLPDIQAHRRPSGSLSVPITGWARRLADPVYTPPRRNLPYDFRPGVPDVGRFPLDVWRRIAARELRGLSGELGYYGETAGCRPLRAAIARYLARSRAVVCEAEEVVVTSGSQQALDLLARVLVEPGDHVVVEDPAYPAAVAAFRAAGARLKPVPVDDEGLRVDRLPPAARLAYVTPSHQFPLGVPLALHRRYALLEWAVAKRAVIIEDDYDGEFRYAGRPLESLHGLDRVGSVVYLGTFSKVLFPGLRLGYVVLPPSLRRPFLAAKWITDRHTAVLEQRIMGRFMTDGHFARYLRRLQGLYASRRAVLLEALATYVSDWITPRPSMGGLHLTGSLLRRVAIDEVIERAAATGVGLYSIAPFFLGTPGPGLVFGYGACGEAEIREGIRRLANVLATV